MKQKIVDRNHYGDWDALLSPDKRRESKFHTSRLSTTSEIRNGTKSFKKDQKRNSKEVHKGKTKRHRNDVACLEEVET